MYCIKCGVKLAEGEERCPLCQTKVYHPDLVMEEGESLYPKKKYPTERASSRWPQILLTAFWLIPALIVLICDIQYGGGVSWSAYVIGALALGYVLVILPTWFKKPNPIVFVPCDFAAAALYLLLIDLMTGGGWFLSFALPVTAGVALITTAVVTLMRCVPKGAFYIFGGAGMALGAFMLLVEYLMCATFEGVAFVGWSFYPLAVLVVLGGALIFLGICRPVREMMERKFFL